MNGNGQTLYERRGHEIGDGLIRVGKRVNASEKLAREAKKHREKKERAYRSLTKHVHEDWLYPADCYKIPNNNWGRPRHATRPNYQRRLNRRLPSIQRPILMDAPQDDLVARMENALLAGMVIPDHFCKADLELAYVPNRRVVAFAYATLRPEVRDNFKAAAVMAHVPYSEFTNMLVRRKQDAIFLSEFWSESIAARSGIVMLYAEKYAALGSPQHLRILGELAGKLQDPASKHQHEHAHTHRFALPDESEAIDVTPERKALPPKHLDILAKPES